jgi:hypothetical protein
MVFTRADHEAQNGSNGAGPANAGAEGTDTTDTVDETSETLVATVATIGVVGVGVAVFEAALLPGGEPPPFWRRNLCRNLALP